VNLSRRWLLFLLAFGACSWVIWVTFIKNVANDPRSFTGNKPHAFFIVHLVLSIVSIGLGTVIGWLGFNGVRSTRNFEK
jgi:hypothetical protein